MTGKVVLKQKTNCWMSKFWNTCSVTHWKQRKPQVLDCNNAWKFFGGTEITHEVSSGTGATPTTLWTCPCNPEHIQLILHTTRDNYVWALHNFTQMFPQSEHKHVCILLLLPTTGPPGATNGLSFSSWRLEYTLSASRVPTLHWWCTEQRSSISQLSRSTSLAASVDTSDYMCMICLH